jgi:hypothetical protein
MWKKKPNDPCISSFFICSELYPVLLCVRAIHTFYCLPCFFFFVSFFFSIRITTVHTENQNIKKKLNKQKLVFSSSSLSFVFKEKAKTKNILDENSLYYISIGFILLDILSRFDISWVCNLKNYI